jgi:Phosphotransferase system cellobiose-specific component IIB
MKILIVCIQGLTSGILAKRMTEISRERGDNHEFHACSQFDLEKYQEWADVILLTTQVKSIRGAIEKQYGTAKKIFVISEESMSFSQINSTYQQILHQISNAPVRKPWWQIFWHVLKNTLILCVLLSLPGWFAYGIHLLTGNAVAEDIYESTAKVICLYGACICGYYYAKETSENEITYIVVGLLSLLAMTPSFTTGNIAAAESEFLTITVPNYGFWMLLIYLPFMMLAFYCYQHLALYVKKQFFGKSVIMSDFNMISFTIVCTIDLGVLFVMRSFLSIFF